jgi:hypothetical protein
MNKYLIVIKSGCTCNIFAFRDANFLHSELYSFILKISVTVSRVA